MKLSGETFNTKNQGFLTQCTAQLKSSVLQDIMGARNLHAFNKPLEKFMGKSLSTTVK